MPALVSMPLPDRLPFSVSVVAPSVLKVPPLRPSTTFRPLEKVAVFCNVPPFSASVPVPRLASADTLSVAPPLTSVPPL